MLAMRLESVIIRDREAEDPNACWIAHADCAERIIATVNDQIGYARVYIYGPAVGDGTCAATDCPHK
jgi:hypothetical protein